MFYEFLAVTTDSEIVFFIYHVLPAIYWTFMHEDNDILPYHMGPRSNDVTNLNQYVFTYFDIRLSCSYFCYKVTFNAFELGSGWQKLCSTAASAAVYFDLADKSSKRNIT